MERKWGALCECVLCKADRADSPGGRLIRADMPQKLANELGGTEGVKRRIAELMNSYRNTPERRLCGLKPELHWAYLKLGRFYQDVAASASQSKPLLENCAQAIMDAMEALGVVIKDRSLSGRVPVTDPPHCPVDVHRPILFPHMCVPLMMIVSAAFSALRQDVRSANWLHAAVWVETQWVGTLVGNSNFF